MSEVIDAEDETDGVQDVGFTGTVQTGNGVKFRVPFADDSAGGVALETLKNDFFNVHLVSPPSPPGLSTIRIEAGRERGGGEEWSTHFTTTSPSTHWRFEDDTCY